MHNTGEQGTDKLPPHNGHRHRAPLLNPAAALPTLGMLTRGTQNGQACLRRDAEAQLVQTIEARCAGGKQAGAFGIDKGRVSSRISLIPRGWPGTFARLVTLTYK